MSNPSTSAEDQRESADQVRSDTSRRLKLMPVSDTFLVQFCKAGPPRWVRIIANPLPDDAESVQVIATGPNRIALLIQSATFDPVPEGTALDNYPELSCTMMDVIDQQPTSDSQTEL